MVIKQNLSNWPKNVNRHKAGRSVFLKMISLTSKKNPLHWYLEGEKETIDSRRSIDYLIKYNKKEY